MSTTLPRPMRSASGYRPKENTQPGREFRIQALEKLEFQTSGDSRAYLVGGIPTTRVNATLNVLAEL